MEWKKLYPGGKKKAVTFSYDDGVEQDIRLTELFRQYGAKATFNLNSGLDESGSWNFKGAAYSLCPDAGSVLWTGDRLPRQHSPTPGGAFSAGTPLGALERPEDSGTSVWMYSIRHGAALWHLEPAGARDDREIGIFLLPNGREHPHL